MPDPVRGEIWLVDFDPTRGHEQAGIRPGLVISVDLFNIGPADLAVVLPLTTVDKAIPFHVEIIPPEGVVKTRSFVKCEDIRSVAKERLTRPWRRVSDLTLEAVEDRLRILLGL